MIHKAKDLSHDQKAVIESLPGRRVLENEAISVRAIEPQAISDARRAEILSGLEKYFEQVDAKPLSMRRCAPPVRTTNLSGEGSSRC
jgi:hypothetical protein